MRRSASVAPVLVVLLSLLVTGCIPQMRSSGERTRSDSLVREDLRDYGTVLDAVQNLRPEWLRQRTPIYLANSGSDVTTRAASPVWVYWDGTRLGDPSSLGRISPQQVQSVRYFDARTASNRWGINHENGVIYLTPALGSVGPGM